MQRTIIACGVFLASMCVSASGEPTTEITKAIIEDTAEVLVRVENANPDTDVARKRAERYGFAKIEPVEQLLNQLYGDQKRIAGVAAMKGRVVLVIRDGLSATSTAAGNIYLGIDWISVIDREDEWAALIAHELGHVLLNHHRSVFAGNTSADVSSLAGLLKSFAKPGSNASRKIEKFNEKAKSFGDYSDKNLHPSRNRETEMQADAVALKILASQGYGLADGLYSAIDRVEASNAASAKLEQAAKPATSNPVNQSVSGKFDKKNFIPSLKEGARQALADSYRGDGKLHPDAEARLQKLAALIDTDYASYRPTFSAPERWPQMRSSPNVQSRLEAYIFSKKLLDATLANDYSQVDKLTSLVPLAQGQIHEGLFSLLEGIYWQRKGKPIEASLKFQKAARSPDASWLSVEAWHSSYLRMTNSMPDAEKQKVNAANIYYHEYVRFGMPVQFQPRVINVLRYARMDNEANTLQSQCEEQFPTEKSVCHGVQWNGF